jgi:hypothetical protein
MWSLNKPGTVMAATAGVLMETHVKTIEKTKRTRLRALTA